MTEDEGLILVCNFNQIFEIENFLDKLAKFSKKENVIILDDGSTDGSDNLAESKGYKVIRHLINRGVGAVIRTGIHYAQSQKKEFVTLMSSNGKVRPEDLATIMGPILREEAEYVTGSRFLAGAASPGLPGFRKLMIPVVSLLSTVILKRRFSDITCGYRCYKLSIFDDPRMRIDEDWLNRYEMEYYIHYWACRQNIRIVEVPVKIMYSHLAKGRVSKITPILGWWSMMRPFVLLFFGIKK